MFLNLFARRNPFLMWSPLEVCVPGLVFYGPNFFLENQGNFPSRAFKTSQFPSRLIPAHSRLATSQKCKGNSRIWSYYTQITSYKFMMDLLNSNRVSSSTQLIQIRVKITLSLAGIWTHYTRSQYIKQMMTYQCVTMPLFGGTLCKMKTVQWTSCMSKISEDPFKPK